MKTIQFVAPASAVQKVARKIGEKLTALKEERFDASPRVWALLEEAGELLLKQRLTFAEVERAGLIVEAVRVFDEAQLEEIGLLEPEVAEAWENPVCSCSGEQNSRRSFATPGDLEYAPPMVAAANCPRHGIGAPYSYY